MIYIDGVPSAELYEWRTMGLFTLMEYPEMIYMDGSI